MPETFYVDRDSVGGLCSDTRTPEQATDPATPWCSLAHAVAATPDPGTVMVRSGQYPDLSVSEPGTRTSLVTFRPAPGERSSWTRWTWSTPAGSALRASSSPGR